jgi:ADP-ribose pyrophosphatase YjhB (NUDIX family)
VTGGRIYLERGTARFGYRVCGVALHEGHVLLHRAEHDDFWSMPGGGCELLEPGHAALRREMREEMGVDVRVVRLLWVIENFFEMAGAAHHELGFYFLVDLGPDFHYDVSRPFSGDEEGLRLIFRWYPIDSLEAVRLYPTYLRTALRAIPQATQYVVHRDEE